MGCGSSVKNPEPEKLQAAQTQVQTAVPINLVQGSETVQGQGYEHGSSKKKVKGKGKGKGVNKDSKFQVELSGQYKDYGKEEDAILKKAWMVGNPKVKFSLRENDYEYDFNKMEQINKTSGKTRSIRKPYGFPDKPKTSLLPMGPMIVITIKPGQPGTSIQVEDTNNPGAPKIPVFVPATAKPGSKMAVPVPERGQTIQQLQEKQQKHHKEANWSTGSKVALSGAALVGVGVVGVGGIILGDHLAGGDMAGDLADTALGVGEHIVDVGEDVLGDVGDVVGDIDMGDAIDAVGDFGEDAVDWLGDGFEDVGDFLMDLF